MSDFKINDIVMLKADSDRPSKELHHNTPYAVQSVSVRLKFDKDTFLHVNDESKTDMIKVNNLWFDSSDFDYITRNHDLDAKYITVKVTGSMVYFGKEPTLENARVEAARLADDFNDDYIVVKVIEKYSKKTTKTVDIVVDKF